MKVSRLLFLLCRYFTLICTGIALAFLWNTCRLGQYEHWGRFYAIWFPLLFGFFSTAYVIAAACLTHGCEKCKEIHDVLHRFRRYDDYTYLLLLWVCVLEIAAPYLQNVYLWLAISYLALIFIKGGLFLTYLYHGIGYDDQLDMTSDSALNISESEETSARNISGRRWMVPLRIQCLLGLAVLMMYVLISAYHMRRASITGDEPHYLLITHSLLHDHDRNLYNNYQHRDYESFFWYELKPAWGDQVSDTAIYSYRHSGGFPHTLIPGYLIGGQWGTVFQINLITALIMLQIFLLSYELFHSLHASFITWICSAFTVPFIVYMGQIYPETLAALLTIWAVRRIRRLMDNENPEGSWRNRQFWQNGLYIAIALLLIVAMKTRYLPVAGTIALMWFVYLLQGQISIKHKFKACIGLVILLMLAVVAIMLVDTFFYSGNIWERIKDFKFMAWILSSYNPLHGLLGLMFDQEYGLLAYAPLYAMALVGIGMLRLKELQAAWPLLFIWFVNYLVISFWPLWHAAPTPPSRYILPVLPLLCVFWARFFLLPHRLLIMLALGISGIWSVIVTWFLTLTPWWRYNWADGVSNFLEMMSLRLSVDVTKLFPSWIRPSLLTPYVTALGVVGIGILIFLSRRRARAPQASTYSLSFAFRFMLMIAVFLLVSVSGLVIGKKLPTVVLEVEDLLDVRTHGGQKVPPSLDPWENQQYLRQWKFYGWEFPAGASLETRPKLVPGELKLDIYARTPEEESNGIPVMLVLVNGKEIGRTPVTSIAWKVYTFPLVLEESRPHIEIHCEGKQDTEGPLIIDKMRFRR